MPDACMNCGAPLSDAYCSRCGQKGSTRRFSLRHMLQEDFMKGVLEIDHGLLFTLKQLAVRPGHAVREYIAGKRVNYYNYLTLLLLILALDVMILEFATVKISAIYNTTVKDANFIDVMDKMMKDYQKLLTLGTIPLYALFSFLVFKRAKQNFAEHLVINAYRAAAELAISIIISISMALTSDVSLIQVIAGIISAVIFFYSLFFYYQYFSVFTYNRVSLVVRSAIAASSLILVTVVLIFVFAVIAVLKGKGIT